MWKKSANIGKRLTFFGGLEQKSGIWIPILKIPVPSLQIFANALI